MLARKKWQALDGLKGRNELVTSLLRNWNANANFRYILFFIFLLVKKQEIMNLPLRKR